MQIVQTNTFRKAAKRLHVNQKSDLDEAVESILADNEIGVLKTGDLAGIRVYKFAMNKQHTLLAYTFSVNALVLTLLARGSPKTSTAI